MTRHVRQDVGGRSSLVRVAAVAASMVVLSGCWLQIGADGGQTRFNAVEWELTAANVATLREVWSVELPGTLSEPIVSRGRVYLTRNAYDRTAAHVHAFDVGTGTTVWEEQLADGLGDPHARVTGRPVSMVGDQLWSGHSVAASASGGQVCEAAGDVFDPATGERTVVGTTAPGPSASAGGVTARFVYSIGSGGEPNSLCGALIPTLLEVDSRRPDGSGSRWTAPVAGGTQERPAPTIGSGQVYAVSADLSSLVAFDVDGCGAATCEPVWTSDVRPDTGLAAVPNGPLVVLQGNRLVALDQATGALLWQALLPPPGGGQRLAVANGVVYVTSFSQLYAFSAFGCWSPTCFPMWSANLQHRGGPLVVGGGVVYVAAGDDILAFPAGGCWAATCPPIATVPLRSYTTATELSLAQGHLFVAVSTVIAGGPGGPTELGHGRLVALAPT